MKSLSAPILRTWSGLPKLLLAVTTVAQLPALATGCASSSSEPISSTDTGNPPVIDVRAIRVTASDDGVVVSGEAGAIEPGGSSITVKNETTGDSVESAAAEDGSFEVELSGELDDEYTVRAERGSRSDSVSVSGSADGPDPAPLDLEDREFRFVAGDGFMPVPGSSVELRFGEDGRLTVTGGCNIMGFECSPCTGELCCDAAETTTIGCAMELHDQDSWLSEFLTSRPRAELSVDNLELIGSDATLQFQDTDALDIQRPLTGADWLVDSYFTANGTTSTTASTPTITFSTDGTFDFYTGCNNGGGEYSSTDTTLTFSGVAVTEEGCSDEFSSQMESHLLTVLTDGDSLYDIDGDTLEISRDGVGITAVTR